MSGHLHKRATTLLSASNKYRSDKHKEINKEIIDKHVANLAVVLETLWLRRNAETSRFFGHALVKIPSNHHQVIKCTLFKEFYSVVNNPIKVICNKMRTKFAKAHEILKSGKYRIQEPKLEATRWLIKASQERVLSTFLRLGTLADTASLKLSQDQDFKRRWMKICRGKLYKLESTTTSPYENHIDNICSTKNCPKIAAIASLI